jgi:hypothetical protein
MVIILRSWTTTRIIRIYPKKIESYRGDVVFIKGLVEDEQRRTVKNIRYFNFMTSRQLEQILMSDIVSRLLYYNYGSGKTRQKPFYPNSRPIWTIILGKKLQEEGLAPYAEQDDFKIDYLPQIKKYSGLQYFDKTPDWEQLFSVFKFKNNTKIKKPGSYIDYLK